MALLGGRRLRLQRWIQGWGVMGTCTPGLDVCLTIVIESEPGLTEPRICDPPVSKTGSTFTRPVIHKLKNVVSKVNIKLASESLEVSVKMVCHPNHVLYYGAEVEISTGSSFEIPKSKIILGSGQIKLSVKGRSGLAFNLECVDREDFIQPTIPAELWPGPGERNVTCNPNRINYIQVVRQNLSEALIRKG
ncbi:hypothetical protein EVAR_102574_1 [Eumeta japonica]|uniref:Uncharacterized protein n=1 Tax=Eumeta variegata TaxID=151549 RepID=A0A4C1SPG2_EUMVA|nr:hypothetical protein EVAR_102574_1 [Eumeta japonica]